MDNYGLDIKMIKYRLSRLESLSSIERERYLTPAELAGKLKVSRNHIYRMIQKGEIDAVRIGKNYRIPYSQFLP